MNRVELLSSSTDLQTVAADISALLDESQNTDIALEFPGSVARYTGDKDKVVANLQSALVDCSPGARMQFIAYSAERAVGMSVVRIIDEVPEGVESSWPNISLFICHPYRGQGLGRLSLLAQLSLVENDFGGKAWTEVKKLNTPSTRLVTHGGFVPVNETPDKVVYIYDNSK